MRLALSIAVAVGALGVSGVQAGNQTLPALVAEAQTATWKCQDKLGQVRTKRSHSPWNLPKSDAYRQWTHRLWGKRESACLSVLREQARQWDWQSWLPDKWRRIGVCETQLNWRHSNSSYQGAFGFAISSWDGFKLSGYPDEAWQATPWQQYQVALAIYSRYGLTGWGCRNA